MINMNSHIFRKAAQNHIAILNEYAKGMGRVIEVRNGVKDDV